MNRHCLVHTFALFFLFTCAGCNTSVPPKGQTAVTPEDAYRSFMVAILTGEESAIRPLILDHEDAGMLWNGDYPPQVAAALSKQYQEMEISRVATADAERIVLKSSAAPMPITVVRVNDEWKVDADPIIEFRKAAEKLKQKSP